MSNVLLDKFVFGRSDDVTPSSQSLAMTASGYLHTASVTISERTMLAQEAEAKARYDEKVSHGMLTLMGSRSPKEGQTLDEFAEECKKLAELFAKMTK